MRSIDPYIKKPEWEQWGRLKCLCKNHPGEIGYLNWIVDDNKLEIADLLIHKKKHRQIGIGSMLIKELLELASENGIEKVWGITQWDDYPVHDFYRKHGFVFDSHMKDGQIGFYQHI
jgi:GNAT superfamily N-acetyltransferase